MRPCPGMTIVPPAALASGTMMSIRRFIASTIAWMLPPPPTSITGYAVRSSIPPALTTSDFRNRTMLLLSVFAGMVHDDDRLIVEVEPLLLDREGVVGPPSSGMRGALPGWPGDPVKQGVVGDDRRAGDVERALRPGGVVGLAERNGLAGVRDRRVPADVFVELCRVDDVAAAAWWRSTCIAAMTFGLIAARPVSTISTPVVAGLHGDVAPRADEHVDVALDRQHLDLARRGCAQSRRPDGLAAGSLIALRRDGLARTPISPRHAQWRAIHSLVMVHPIPGGAVGSGLGHRLHLRDVLRIHRFRPAEPCLDTACRTDRRASGSVPAAGSGPGRKCGTVPRGTAVSVASSHG